MEREGQTPEQFSAHVPAAFGPQGPLARTAKSRWPHVFVLCLVLLVGISVGFYFLPNVAPNGIAQPKDDNQPPAPQTQFAGWAKPDLVIVVSGEMHGHMQPCGCSDPQYGGLSRRYNFIQSLRDKGWPVVAVDVGEIAQTHGPQSMIKYTTSMKALELMNYSAVGLGRTEFNMPTFQTLANYALNHPNPTPIASNLLKTAKDQEFYDMNVRQFKVVDSISPRLGIVSVVDQKTQLQITDKDAKFLNPVQALAPVLKDVKAARAELIALLYQGNETDQEAVQFVKTFNKFRATTTGVPGVSFVLCLSSDPEPPGRPKAVDGTQIITVGHKGRYVGVIGLFKAKVGNAFELKYELIAIGPQYATPAGQERNNPINVLMEEYARTIQKEDYISKFPRKPHHLLPNSKFVGTDRCIDCHQHAGDVWAGKFDPHSKHAKAFQALAEAKNPSLRHHDGECVVCHTVGFQYHGGYFDKTNNPKLHSKLLNVGCENCHGPGSEHVNNPQNAALYPLINPHSTNPKRFPEAIANNPALLKAQIHTRLQQQDRFCQQCHDLENDVHWTKVPYEQKWKHINHITTPRLAIAGAPAPNPGGTPVVNPGPIRIENDLPPAKGDNLKIPEPK